MGNETHPNTGSCEKHYKQLKKTKLKFYVQFRLLIWAGGVGGAATPPTGSCEQLYKKLPKKKILILCTLWVWGRSSPTYSFFRTILQKID